MSLKRGIQWPDSESWEEYVLRSEGRPVEAEKARQMLRECGADFDQIVVTITPRGGGAGGLAQVGPTLSLSTTIPRACGAQRVAWELTDMLQAVLTGLAEKDESQ